MPLTRDYSQNLVYLVDSTSFQTLHEAYDHLSETLPALQPEGTVILLFNSVAFQEEVSCGRIAVPPGSIFHTSPSVKDDPMRNSICDAFNHLYKTRFPAQKLAWAFCEPNSDPGMWKILEVSIQNLVFTLDKDALLENLML